MPNGTLVIAWAGDSMAIVFRPQEVDDSWPPFCSTRSKRAYPDILYRLQEHTLYVKEECDRIARAGGIISDISSVKRLIPPEESYDIIRERRLAVNMARALGHILLSKCGLIPNPEFSPPIIVKPGDRLLIASDGLFPKQRTEEIACTECEYAKPQAAALHMVERSLAWDREKSYQSDNTTCVCVHFTAPPPPR